MSDGFKGFRKLHHFPNVALGVSKTGMMEVGKVYEAPASWQWGSNAEVAAISNHASTWLLTDRSAMSCNYQGHGGWERGIWGGVERHFFLFSDSLQAGGYMHDGDREGRIDESLTVV